MKGGTSENLSSFYFHNSWIFVEVMTQNLNFPINEEYSILPARILKECTRSHFYKQSSHGDGVSLLQGLLCGTDYLTKYDIHLHWQPSEKLSKPIYMTLKSCCMFILFFICYFSFCVKHCDTCFVRALYKCLCSIAWSIFLLHFALRYLTSLKTPLATAVAVTVAAHGYNSQAVRL